MHLDYAVGVDLGSTTTKAVLLGREGQILGRGITNSRSNYDVACQVAMTEGLNNTRFSLVEDALDSHGVDAKQRAILVAKLRRAFQKQQYLSQLQNLRAELEKAHASTSAPAAALDAVGSILTQMAETASELFRPGAPRRSDFFRDQAGGLYHELAETHARDHGVNFDVLVGLFDKAILEAENTPASDGEFQRHAGAALEEAGNDTEVLREAVLQTASTDLNQIASVGTGYGRARLPFAKKQIRSEILCHGLGAHAMFPGTRTVLDIGGQDTKGIQVDPEGIVTSFQMNDRCAAGCGRYLGYIADEMNLGLHQLGPLASQSTRKVKINSTCTVFAGAELRERLSLGEKREDILAGLHRAIILRAMSILARSGGVDDQFTFTGGVANNSAAVSSLKQLIFENYGELTVNISPDSIYTGALGAAIFALRATEEGSEPEESDDESSQSNGSMITAGIDVGSSAIKVAVVECKEDGTERMLSGRAERMRRRDAIKVTGELFDQVIGELGLKRNDLGYIATTGEGENIEFRTGHFYGMTTHARGGLMLEPEARAVIDIGALHTRAVLMDERAKVLGYRMTSQCASGSGRFLENIGRYLGVTIDELGPLSLSSQNPEKCSSICAVLAETDVINMVSRGIAIPDIVKGIHQSMAGRYVRLLASSGARGVVLVTGGLAADVGLLEAMRESAAERKYALELRSHEDSILAGALGAAVWGAFRARRLAQRGVNILAAGAA